MNLNTLLRLWPPFGGTGAGAEPTLEAAARVRLVESVTGLTEVYLGRTASRAVMPFAVISPLRFSVPTITNTDAYYEITPLQVTIFSESDITANTLGRAALRALRASPRLLFDDGYHMTGWPGGLRQWPAAEVGPGGATAFRFEFDWVFQVGRALA